MRDEAVVFTSATFFSRTTNINLSCFTQMIMEFKLITQLLVSCNLHRRQHSLCDQFLIEFNLMLEIQSFYCGSHVCG